MQKQPNDAAIEAQAQRELMQLAISVAGIGTFAWDIRTQTLTWDDQSIELFGYDREEFDGVAANFTDRLHPDDSEFVLDQMRNAMKVDGEFQLEYRIVVPGGKTKWIGGRGHAITDDNGEVISLLGVAWDATSRAEHEALISRGLESMSTPYFSLDSSWNFSYANPEAARVLGTPRQDLIGRNIWELFPAAVGSDFESNGRRSMKTGEPIAFDAFYPEPLNKWFEVRAWRNPDGLGVYFIDVTNRHVAQEQAAHAAARANSMAQISQQLAATLDSVEASRRLAGLVVPALADWCIVTLVDDEQHGGNRTGLGHVIALHSDPAMQATLQQYAADRLDLMSDTPMIVKAIETGQASLVQNDAMKTIESIVPPGPVLDSITTLAPYSLGVLPLMGRISPIGILTLAKGTKRGEFSNEEWMTITEACSRAGLLLENGRLYRQQRELAEQFQRSLLSPGTPSKHIDVAVRYSPAAEIAQVGGDWYDNFVQPKGHMVVVIGDVVGHDSHAAAGMSQVRTMVRTIGVIGDDGPASILEQVDRSIDLLQVDTPATAVVARIEKVGKRVNIRWSNAGHPPPLVLEADGAVNLLTTKVVDPLIGAMSNVTRREQSVPLKPGSVVLFYTDGLIERRDQSINDGLVSLSARASELAGVPLEEFCDQVLEHMLPLHPEDDVAVVAIKV